MIRIKYCDERKRILLPYTTYGHSEYVAIWSYRSAWRTAERGERPNAPTALRAYMESSMDGLMDWIYINDILTYGGDIPG